MYEGKKKIPEVIKYIIKMRNPFMFLSDINYTYFNNSEVCDIY